MFQFWLLLLVFIRSVLSIPRCTLLFSVQLCSSHVAACLNNSNVYLYWIHKFLLDIIFGDVLDLYVVEARALASSLELELHYWTGTIIIHYFSLIGCRISQVCLNFEKQETSYISSYVQSKIYVSTICSSVAQLTVFCFRGSSACFLAPPEKHIRP